MDLFTLFLAYMAGILSVVLVQRAADAILRRQPLIDPDDEQAVAEYLAVVRTSTRSRMLDMPTQDVADFYDNPGVHRASFDEVMGVSLPRPLIDAAFQVVREEVSAEFMKRARVEVRGQLRELERQGIRLGTVHEEGKTYPCGWGKEG